MAGYTLQDKCNFIERLYDYAKPAYEASGISLQFILAQSAAEVSWGRSVYGNNLFNIKADSSWTGPTVINPADGLSYRAYSSWKESVNDYISFLRSNPRYNRMFDPDVRGNVEKLAKVVADAGYAERADYASYLIRVAKGPTMRAALRQYDPGPYGNNQYGPILGLSDHIDPFKALYDSSLAYAFTPKLPGALVPTSTAALQLEQWMDTNYPGVPRYRFRTIEELVAWQHASGWWEYIMQGGSPPGRPWSEYPMTYAVGMHYLAGGGRQYVAFGWIENISAYQPDPRDPLILDLDGDGIETTTLADGAYFDHDKNGFAEKTSWASPDDGLLAMDRNGNGVIDDGAELFGNQTTMPDGSNAMSGFHALAALDSNADHKIDMNDPVFSQLRIWQDIDGDGELTLRT